MGSKSCLDVTRRKMFLYFAGIRNLDPPTRGKVTILTTLIIWILFCLTAVAGHFPSTLLTQKISTCNAESVSYV